jgi:hypothetical protein
MADFWRIPFPHRNHKCICWTQKQIVDSTERSVSAEVCECTHKFRITNTSVEILKKRDSRFWAIFTFEKECFTIIFLLISADGRFLKNSLSTPKSQVYMLDSETNCRLHRKEVCQPKFANVHTNLELLILSVEILKKRDIVLSQFHLWKRMFFYHLFHFKMRFKAI